MIELKNITYGYKAKSPIFKDFSFRLPEEGCICGLLGENGAGKSTLLHLMSGLLLPRRGNVVFEDKEVGHRLPSCINQIFLVPEELSLPDMSLRQYVREMSVFYPRFSHEDFQSYLRAFGMEGADHTTSLSMGQKKKVFISFAIATNTRVLLMDEPTNGLDINGKSQFRKLMATAVDAEPRLWMISTHQVGDIERLIDHVAILHGNHIVFNENVERISQQLCFIDIEGEDTPAGTLASASTFAGSRVMLPNGDGLESDISLELLFNGVLNNGEKIATLFNE